MILAAQISVVILIAILLLGAAGYVGAIEVIEEGEAE